MSHLIISKEMFRRFIKVVFRKKAIRGNVLDTELKRCFNLFSLTMLGLGTMVGSGIFVTTGTLAKNVAGPAIVLSYFISGFSAFLSRLCYAELGSSFPKAGSAYSHLFLDGRNDWFLSWMEYDFRIYHWIVCSCKGFQ